MRCFTSSNNLSISDPYRCGYVHPSKTRSIFIYTPNITHPKDPEVVTEDFGNATVNQTNLFGLNEDDIIENLVEEEPILPESSGHMRIVNGVDCPPGECPWQVKRCSRSHVHVVMYDCLHMCCFLRLFSLMRITSATVVEPS